MAIKKSYVDSHWLVYIFQGIISLLFGWYIMFTPSTDINMLVAIVGTVLLGLGIIEMFNVIYRAHMQHTWVLNLTIAVIEICVAFLLLFTLGQGTALQLTIIAAYTLARGIFEILISLKSIDDLTDKFIWMVCGVCGAILGFVVFNAGNFSTNAFLQFFGTYMMIFGVSNLIYGAHNHDQEKEYALQQNSRRKSVKKSAKQSVKKTTKKSTKKPAKTSKKK
ncbi:DUF308 domain-containing protein [Candidatus Saccharibacteria bacterium]|nr:DUF308 domain-containing protein [Candidatus Saccharibacteria bacterium]